MSSRSRRGPDAEYYCLHHPDALVPRYKIDCDCRKPKPGLLIRAAEENGIDLGGSFFVGDALDDVKAGRAAGLQDDTPGARHDLPRGDDREGKGDA